MICSYALSLTCLIQYIFIGIYIMWFFSNLVGEEGSKILEVKDSRVCFLKALSAILTIFVIL